MLNSCILMGRLTRDPEVRTAQNDLTVAGFTLAVDRDRSNADGSRDTDFIDVTAFGSTAEFVRKYFSKGRMAVVSGRLQIDNWTDKNGNKRKSAKVIANSVYFGDSKPSGNSTATKPPAQEYADLTDEEDDDLPF